MSPIVPTVSPPTRVSPIQDPAKIHPLPWLSCLFPLSSSRIAAAFGFFLTLPFLFFIFMY